MKSVFCCISFVLCLICVDAAVQIGECDPPLSPIEFRFNNCSSNVCHDVMDDGVNLGIDFTAQHSSQNMTLELGFYVLGYYFPYTIYNVCEFLVDESCPLVVGQNYTISHHLKVPEDARGFKIATEATLIDEKERQHFCLKFEFLLN